MVHSKPIAPIPGLFLPCETGSWIYFCFLFLVESLKSFEFRFLRVNINADIGGYYRRGLEYVQEALDTWAKGVSAKKIVVSL